MDCRRRLSRCRRMTVLLLATAAAFLPLCEGASAQTLPPDFREDTIFSGLTQPTAVAFAADGRVFVGEKRGLIKVFTSLQDTTPDVVADLRSDVLPTKGCCWVPNTTPSPFREPNSDPTGAERTRLRRGRIVT